MPLSLLLRLRTICRFRNLALRDNQDRREYSALPPANASSAGHDVDTVDDEGLRGHGDTDIWAGAQRDGRLLITQDLDFSDRRAYAAGSHHGLLVIRLKQPGREALRLYIQTLIQEYDLSTWAGRLVIGTEQKVRIKAAPF